jgi:hypothetical protein
MCLCGAFNLQTKAKDKKSSGYNNVNVFNTMKGGEFYVICILQFKKRVAWEENIK